MSDRAPAGAGPQKKHRWGLGAALVASLLVVIGVGSWVALRVTDSTAPHRENVGAGPIPGTVLVGRVSSVSEQMGTCAGISQPTNLVRLTAPLHIEAVTVCPLVGGSKTTKRNTRNTRAFDELSRSLATADTPPGSNDCPAVLPTLWAFVITVDGQLVRPAVPIGGCGFPLGGAQTAIQAFA